MEQFPQQGEEPASASASSSSSPFTMKLHELLGESDTEEGTDDGSLCFQEEVVEGVMQEFYKEIAASKSKVFINQGDNESCGASVSDNGSSVMAGIAGSGGFPVTENGFFSGMGCEGFGTDDDDGLLEFGGFLENKENNNNNNNENENINVNINNSKKKKKKMEDALDGGVDVDDDDEWIGMLLN
ncbi:hypothetical protein PIB30_015886 [Stylosanthes scabra]|uniref:Uncharacterized protein n=1 Tax=Stylosanthes scabra TaxID=79078 RepID=A0ABU6T6U6_9FABA|nr:hypothetical protein [Stylosanthes scabra]